MWLGLADPCDTRVRVEDNDPVRMQLAWLLTALSDVFGTENFTVNRVLATEDPALKEAVGPVLSGADARANPGQVLGLFFHSVMRRPEGGLRLAKAGTKRGSAQWRVERV